MEEFSFPAATVMLERSRRMILVFNVLQSIGPARCSAASRGNGACPLLWAIIGLLISVWIVALLCSFTLGGWIHLLPLAAAPLVVIRLSRAEPDAAEFEKWKRANARLRRR